MRHDPANPSWPERDRFILSKGHACPVLYAVLAEWGYTPVDQLKTLRKLAEVAPDGRPLTRSGRLNTGRTVRSSESYAEEDGEIFGAAMASGCGANAALEELNYVRSRRGR